MNFQILGPLRVVDDNDRELALGGPKPGAILALLILHVNEPVSADRLIEELWEGQPPPTAAKSLQVHISRLRRFLGGDGSDHGAAVVTRGGGYALEADPDQIDAHRFERAVAEGCAALAEGAHSLASTRLRCALGFWRGDALADFAYASFAQDPVARLDGLRTVALEGAIEAELALGRHGELIPELKSLVARHPLSERLRAQLMLALYRAGRQAEALGVYRAARRVLVDQLGIEPGVELRELERGILAQDPDLAAPALEQRVRRERAAGTPGGLLVGYDQELSALEAVLESALVGQGRVALLSGEPGVGKTRLADELTRVAHARGAQVVWARCWDGGGAPAFWPWTQAIRGLVGDRDPAAVHAELGESAGDLAQLLPELAFGDRQRARARDTQEDRFRLFDATTSFLRRSAAARPIVLVFDDLHAADAATLSLLEFAGAAAANAPILIVGTYRDTDVTGNDALTHAFAELTRTSDCLQLVLTGLTTEDTAHFVEVSSGAAPMATLAAAIHDVSAGNPLFVTELVRLLQAEGRLTELDHDGSFTLPRGIEQVIARRLQQLSESCRRTLLVAAVAGNEIEARVIERAGQEDPIEVSHALDEAHTARVIDRAESGREVFRFSHDLVRQTLYAQLGTGERRRLHAAVAAALEQLNPGNVDSVLPRVAHHYAEAVPEVDTATAVGYLLRAGDAAAEVMAFEDAAGWYARAVDISGEAGLSGNALGELYVKLAEQTLEAGDGLRTAAALAGAGACIDVELDPALAGRLAVVEARHDLTDACTGTIPRVEQVLALFQSIDDPAGEARAWFALASGHAGAGRFKTAENAARQMLASAKRADSHALTEQALRVIAACVGRGTTPASIAAPEVRAILDQVQGAATRARILLYLAEIEVRAGRFDDARGLLAQSRAVAEPGGLPWDDFGMFTTGWLELRAGNSKRAETILREACDSLERRGLVGFLTSEIAPVADALTAQGRFGEADVQLRRGAAILTSHDVHAHHVQAVARGRLELARGNLEEAEAALRTALEWLEQMESPDAFIDAHLVLARIMRATGREDEARAAAEEALALSETIEDRPFADQARELLGKRELASVG